jgi:hypothetical protein
MSFITCSSPNYSKSDYVVCNSQNFALTDTFDSSTFPYWTCSIPFTGDYINRVECSNDTLGIMTFADLSNNPDLYVLSVTSTGTDYSYLKAPTGLESSTAQTLLTPPDSGGGDSGDSGDGTATTTDGQTLIVQFDVEHLTPEQISVISSNIIYTLALAAFFGFLAKFILGGK